MKGHLLFLGTGASLGIPLIGCKCEVCHSESSFNKRLRSSALLKIGDKQILIDVGPDFRMQALKHGITDLDGVILTHAHHDHTAGIDDLRAIYFRREKPFPILLSEATAEEVLKRYYYLFECPSNPSLKPNLTLEVLPKTASGDIFFVGLPIRFVTFEQGGMQVNGFKIGDLAYLSDIKNYSSAIFDQLKGTKTLIISALKYTSSFLHFSVDEAIDFAHKVGAEKTWITHISHELEYEKTNAYLPSNVRMSYDGLEIAFEVENVKT